MNSKVLKSAIFGTLSLHSLIASSAQAALNDFAPSETNEEVTHVQQSPAQMAERIIQKRIVGFDPKQAVETLSYLNEAGVERFEKDGSVLVTPEMIQDIMEVATVDGIEVRILNVEEELVRVKFAAHDLNKFDRTKIEKARQLAERYVLKCDMDGK
ncbi:hypothetical protein [Bdellovibrio sp. NC01]|uniref:hypothetical protein n=1 Tax=Bdellovibrio sp. NC01 TaxID=2220073 RepID=UPI00115AD2DD|nr:hypothetical protein [Bdellovibrio sp. NC01]QDK39340.1 hypothetical protein DOE51_17930 [Bdellovibrio sp. NC01]